MSDATTRVAWLIRACVICLITAGVRAPMTVAMMSSTMTASMMLKPARSVLGVGSVRKMMCAPLRQYAYRQSSFRGRPRAVSACGTDVCNRLSCVREQAAARCGTAACPQECRILRGPNAGGLYRWALVEDLEGDPD